MGGEINFPTQSAYISQHKYEKSFAQIPPQLSSVPSHNVLDQNCQHHCQKLSQTSKFSGVFPPCLFRFGACWCFPRALRGRGGIWGVDCMPWIRIFSHNFQLSFGCWLVVHPAGFLGSISFPAQVEGIFRVRCDGAKAHTKGENHSREGSDHSSHRGHQTMNNYYQTIIISKQLLLSNNLQLCN